MTASTKILSGILSIEEFTINAPSLDQDYTIRILDMSRDHDGALPAIYCTDANSMFDVLARLSWWMQVSRSVCRYSLIGVGYPGRSMLAGSILRSYDLTFDDFPKFDLPNVCSPEICTPVSDAAKSHRGAQFLEFLADHLIPRVEAQLGVDSRHRTYFGHSAGAMFGICALTERPGLFRNTIASSPSLSVHGRLGDRDYRQHDFMIERMKRFVRSHLLSSPASLHISVGTAEETEPGLEVFQLTSSVRRFASYLEQHPIPQLAVTTRLFAGEPHSTSWVSAFTQAARSIFPISGCGAV